MREALIIGTGGHCRVLLSLLAASEKHKVIGIIDLAEPRFGESIMGISDIHPVSSLDEFRGRTNIDVFLAIGENGMRRTWWQNVKNLGLPVPNLISPKAVVDDCARMGEGNVICARAFIGPESVLGNNNLVNTAAVLEHEVRVGSHCHLGPSSTVAGRSQIGDNCFVGVGATVINEVKVAADITIGAGGVVINTLTERGGVYVGIPARKLPVSGS